MISTIDPLFSVIIPTCHRNDSLSICLDCLAPGNQTLEAENYEVIVSDDGSAPTARELIEKHYPWAKWIEGPKRGPAANRNHGARQARGEWLVFTDDDCMPGNGFLAAYRQLAINNKVEVLEGRTQPSGIRSRVDMECPENLTGGYLWSCNMAVKKILFLNMGGFDTGFPGPAMEDVEFRTRLVKAGQRFEFVPDALVLHPWRIRKNMEYLRLHSLSRCYFVNKHPEKAKTLSFTALATELARRLFRQIPPVAFACRGRGLGRELLLTFYTTYALMIYSKKSLSNDLTSLLSWK
jgi:GT2 family glycosyltransferase